MLDEKTWLTSGSPKEPEVFNRVEVRPHREGHSSSYTPSHMFMEIGQEIKLALLCGYIILPFSGKTFL